MLYEVDFIVDSGAKDFVIKKQHDLTPAPSGDVNRTSLVAIGARIYTLKEWYIVP